MFLISLDSAIFPDHLILLQFIRVVQQKLTNFSDNLTVSTYTVEESLKMEAVDFSKTLVYFYQNTWTHIAKTNVWKQVKERL